MSSDVVEHPELDADSIVRCAGAVGREHVVASTDCGLGERVHPQIARAKLETLVKGTELAGSQLWGQSRHGSFGIRGARESERRPAKR
jgi:5-methyltetrahydropteroyltriglutamate--homocysteine methyltransferase